MKLSDYLNSINHAETVTRLNDLIDHVQVCISWWGQRVVKVDAYEGYVEINALASKYLNAKPFRCQSSLSLQQRYDCYILWDRIKQLYLDSDNQLSQTWLFKFLIPLKEARPYCKLWAGDPQTILTDTKHKSNRNRLYQFTPEEFKRYWPNEKPRKTFYLNQCSKMETWFPFPESVEKYLSEKGETKPLPFVTVNIHE